MKCIDSTYRIFPLSGPMTGSGFTLMTSRLYGSPLRGNSRPTGLQELSTGLFGGYAVTIACATTPINPLWHHRVLVLLGDCFVTFGSPTSNPFPPGTCLAPPPPLGAGDLPEFFTEDYVMRDPGPSGFAVLGPLASRLTLWYARRLLLPCLMASKLLASAGCSRAWSPHCRSGWFRRL